MLKKLHLGAAQPATVECASRPNHQHERQAQHKPAATAVVCTYTLPYLLHTAVLCSSNVVEQQHLTTRAAAWEQAAAVDGAQRRNTLCADMTNNPHGSTSAPSHHSEQSARLRLSHACQTQTVPQLQHAAAHASRSCHSATASSHSLSTNSCHSVSLTPHMLIGPGSLGGAVRPHLRARVQLSKAWHAAVRCTPVVPDG
jgi:hypothetical protein